MGGVSDDNAQAGNRRLGTLPEVVGVLTGLTV